MRRPRMKFKNRKNYKIQIWDYPELVLVLYQEKLERFFQLPHSY